MKNLLKRSVLKRSPFKLLKNIDQKIKSGILTTKPPWYDAMALVPMAPMPSAYEDTAKSGAFGGIDVSIGDSQLNFSVNSTRKIQKRKNVSVVPVKMCQEIEYPEDRIRTKFYSSHPFELNRPRSLIDDEHSLLNRNWSSIHGGNIPAPVTGESVIQFTLYLMSEKGGSLKEDVAYELALDEFYKVRRNEEVKEREETKLNVKDKSASLVQNAIESLESLELKSLKPKSESIIKLEQEEVEAGKVFSQQKFAE